jgi:DNA-binding GntR family transcriptional regulator
LTPSKKAVFKKPAPSVSKVGTRKASAKKAASAHPPPTRPLSLTAQAYELIEAQITHLELTPGAAISEAELSQRLGIGRTPVREALQRLAREHLVQILPQRGVLVSDIDIKRQLRLLETRREVERLVVCCAARRATEAERTRFEQLAVEFETAARTGNQIMFMRADKEFNDLSVKGARNEFAAGAMGLMHGLSRRFWFLHHKQANDLEKIAGLHAELSRAISLNDEAGAARALDALIDHNQAFTKETVSTEY